jgi:hypothetical protein
MELQLFPFLKVRQPVQHQSQPTETFWKPPFMLFETCHPRYLDFWCFYRLVRQAQGTPTHCIVCTSAVAADSVGQDHEITSSLPELYVRLETLFKIRETYSLHLIFIDFHDLPLEIWELAKQRTISVFWVKSHLITFRACNSWIDRLNCSCGCLVGCWLKFAIRWRQHENLQVRAFLAYSRRQILRNKHSRGRSSGGWLWQIIRRNIKTTAQERRLYDCGFLPRDLLQFVYDYAREMQITAWPCGAPFFL